MPDQENAFASMLGNQLCVGAVLHRFCEHTDPPKNKFMVVVSIKPRLIVFLINSKINEYYEIRGLDHFHVSICPDDHDFLRHESYANCIEAHHAFDYSEMRGEIISDYNNIFKGFLSDDCLELVYNAAKNNNILRRGEQREIIDSIEKRLPHLADTLQSP